MPKTDKAKNQITAYAPKILVETIQQLEKQNEALRHQLWKYKRKPTGSIGYFLLFIGAIALIWSVTQTSYIPAFIGIALTFWGALLLFIRPTKYIRAELLSPTTLPTFATINLIIKHLNYKGKGIYLPPKHFKGFKGGKLFISSNKNMAIPPPEKIAKEEVFLKNPQGICLTPPGVDLTNLFEEELGKEFTKVNINYLQTALPKLFTEGLEIAEDFEMNTRGNTVHIEVWNPIYKELCNKARKLLKNPCPSFACPPCSAIACALTRVTGKPVLIRKSKASKNGEKIQVYYQIVEE